MERAFGPDRDRIERYAWDTEVVPGIRALGTPGHTPGHTSFLVTSGADSLLVLSDVTNHPALFGRAADEGLRVALYHAPFPATGHVARTATGYEFVPAQWGLD